MHGVSFVNRLISWFSLTTFTQPFNVWMFSFLNHSLVFKFHRSKAPVLWSLLWSTSTSVLYRRPTHPRILSTLSIEPATFMYNRNAYSLLSISCLLLIKNKISTFATQSPFPSHTTTHQHKTAPLVWGNPKPSVANSCCRLFVYAPRSVKHSFQ